jgi:hypothetical protein
MLILDLSFDDIYNIYFKFMCILAMFSHCLIQIKTKNSYLFWKYFYFKFISLFCYSSDPIKLGFEFESFLNRKGKICF